MSPILLLLACGGPSEEVSAPTPAPEAPAVVAPVEAPAPEPAGSPNAQHATHAQLLADLEAERHPSDGGGRAWLEEGPSSVIAGSAHRWVMVYEAGPEGVAEGGSVIFQPPAFWGWDGPQGQVATAPGYTTVETAAEGLRLDARQVDQTVFRVEMKDRGMAPGEQLRLTYGAGEAGARADRFAETAAELWFAVDGDGDGVRDLVDEPVRVDVVPGPPSRLLLTLPTTARPGETVDLVVAALDARGNGPAPLDGAVALVGADTLELPSAVQLDGGTGRARVTLPKPGVYAVQGTLAGLTGTSNPMLVAPGAQRILWGDLQIHTALSDGTGGPEEVWRYARDVAGLDVASITDHDHWGMRFLDQHPELWERSVAAAEAANEPGAFVAIPGMEWTSWVYGHRHLLWFEPDPPLISCLDPETDRPDELWAALEGRRVFTVAHHSAGLPVATDWSFRPPEALEPVTEVVSVHGQSMNPAAPGAVRGGVEGNFVVDQLREGLRVGLIGSTDGHDGHPGLAQLNGPSGGLVAILAEERTRESVYEALAARRVYATNGTRILLKLDAGGVGMGQTLAVDGPVDLELRAMAPVPVSRVVEVRRDGERELEVGVGATVLRHQWTLEPPLEGDFVVLRVETADGGVAWTSPVWFEGEPTE